MRAVAGALFEVGNILREIEAVFDEPLQPLLESWQAVDGVLLQNFHAEKREQPDHRAHAQRHFVAALDEELVVVKAVGFVPQPAVADVVHRVHDLDGVFEKLRRDVLVGGIGEREFQRDGEHGLAVESHPRRAVGLGERLAAGERLRAVEKADVIQPEEAAGEDVFALHVLAVDPPGEVDEELLKDALEKLRVARAGLAADFVDAPAGPRVDGRIHVAEIPLVGGDRAARVHVPLAEEEQELLLRELGIDPRHRDHVKGEVPRGVPRIFPLVRHGDHVGVEEVLPVVIARAAALGGRRRKVRVAGQPLLHDIMVKLLRPQQPGVGLAHDIARLGPERGRVLGFKKRRGLRDAPGENGVEICEGRGRPRAGRREAEPEHDLAAGGNLERVVRRGFRPVAVRVHGVRAPVDDGVVETVFHVGREVRRAEDARVVRFVFREKPRRVGVGGEAEFAERFVRGGEGACVELAEARLERAALVDAAPRPGVAKPQRRQDVQARGVGAAVREREADERVVGRGLRVFGDDIEVARLVEDARVLEFELALLARAARVFLHQPRVGKLRLRIFVERAQVGVGGRGVEIVPDLLGILAVIALRIGQAKDALLQNRVAPVPQRHGKAEPALAVGDAEEPVLAPAVCPAARVIVREVIPRVAIRRIILAHRAPLALREIRPPAFPVSLAPRVFFEAEVFRRERGGHGATLGFLGHRRQSLRKM